MQFCVWVLSLLQLGSAATLRIRTTPVGQAEKAVHRTGEQTQKLAAATTVNHSVALGAQAVVSNVARPQVDIMMCIPARNGPWLKLMRESWLDDAVADKRFGHLVFIPHAAQPDMEEAGKGLQMMRLGNWEGDVASFQGAFTGAIVPCAAHTQAKWYAMLDDDILLFPSALHRLVSKFDTYSTVLYGRKGEPNYPKRIIYGGVMLMNARTTQLVVDNMDKKFDEVAAEASRRGLVVYSGTHAGFNIDHYFSILVQNLGGWIKELPEIAELRPEVWWNRGLPAGDIIAVHHMKQADFEDYLQHPYIKFYASKEDNPPSLVLDWCKQRCAPGCLAVGPR